MLVLLALAAAKLVSVSTNGLVRKETISTETEEVDSAGSRYTCTIQDNVEFLGQRGGKFISTSFPVSQCSRSTCSALNVIGGGAPGRHHVAHTFHAVRARRSGTPKDDGSWCLCRENVDDGRLLISFGGVREEKPCNADQCYKEYVRYVEKFVLDETPGTTGLGRANWRESTAEATASTASYWSRECCDTSKPGCPKPSAATIVPFRSLLKQLETGDPDITGDRARQLQDVAEEQIDLGDSTDSEAPSSGGSNDGTSSSDAPPTPKVPSSGGSNDGTSSRDAPPGGSVSDRDPDEDLSNAAAYDASQDPHADRKIVISERPMTPLRPRRKPVTGDAVRDERIQRGLSPTSAASPVTPAEAGSPDVPAVFRPVLRPADNDLMYAEWQYKWMEPFCLSGSRRVLMSWELACMLVYDDREVPGNFDLCGPEKPPAILKVAPPSMASSSAWVASDVPPCEIEEDACCGRGGCRPEFLDSCVKHLPKDVTYPDVGPGDF